MVVSELAVTRTSPNASEPARTGGATVGAAIAALWLVVAVQALVRWVFSPDFGRARLTVCRRGIWWH